MIEPLLIAQGLCEGYQKYYAEFLSAIELVESEAVFDVPLVNPLTGKCSTSCTLNGRADKLIRDPSGELWLIDHKTTSREPDRRYLQINAQGDTYVLAYQQRGYDVRGILWDYIKKPGIRQTKKETFDDYLARLRSTIEDKQEEYYQQIQVRRWPDDLKQTQYDVWQTHQLLLGCHRVGMWPRNSSACYSNFGQCAYLPLCADDNEMTRAAYIKRDGEAAEGKRSESYSSLTQFRTCPRLYYWQQIERIKPADESEALFIGSEVHAGLDVIYQHGDIVAHFAKRRADVQRTNEQTNAF